MRKIFFLLPILSLLSCSRYIELHGYAQGGTWSVKADLRGSDATKDVLQYEIDSILTLVDTTFSGYNRGSIVSRLNEGKDVVTNPVFDQLLSISDSLRDLSGGVFDVHSAPLFDIWGFGFKADSLPDREEIDKALEECRAGKRLNFNAIAQGYTCDLVARCLKSHGISNMLVDIGEIYLEGVNPKGKPWCIGIDTPADGNNSPGASLSGIWTSDGGAHGIVTSGNYRKFYVKDGQKYAHTIDPRSGYPVRHNLLSATVVAPTATEADAIATWFMVIGFEEARQKAEADPGIEACLITSDEIWYSPGFRTISHPSPDKW